MNAKFVRIKKEELLQELLNKIKPGLSSADYVLGIPRRNYNPLTHFLGNTYLKLHPRSAVPNTGSLSVYYDRVHLSEQLADPEVGRRIFVNESVFLHDILDQVNAACGLALEADDVYNTTIKEFPDGKFFIVLLAHPESTRYQGKLELEVSHRETPTIVLKLVLRVTLIPKPVASPILKLVLRATVVPKI